MTQCVTDMNSTSRRLFSIQRLMTSYKVISNTFDGKHALKGGKCEGNSSCTNNQSYQYLSFIFFSYTIFFERNLFINSLARIVTGLPIFTKTDKLYSETGWATLSSRRHNRKLQLFYNIKNGRAPNYLRELIPPTVQITSIYPLRNGSKLIKPFCRLSITTESLYWIGKLQKQFILLL